MTITTKKLRTLTRRESPAGADILHLYSEETGKDHYVIVSDLLTGQSYDTWDVATTYAIGNRVTFGFKLYESLQNANTGHIPSGGVGDTWWKEVSESSKPDHLERTINKTAHGFVVKNILTLNGSGVLVKVSAPTTDKFIGIVTEVIDVDNFKMVQAGYVTGLSGLTVGSIHYAQADGTLSTTVSDMPVLKADTTTSGFTLSSGGGGTSLTDPLLFKGVVDCSANPNYPAADAGDVYKVSVAGKIGGGSGPNVEVGDTLLCTVDASPSGNHATVGANWVILQTNIDPALYAPLASPTFTGTPAAPTAAPGTSTTQLATTEFTTNTVRRINIRGGYAGVGLSDGF